MFFHGFTFISKSWLCFQPENDKTTLVDALELHLSQLQIQDKESLDRNGMRLNNVPGKKDVMPREMIPKEKEISHDGSQIMQTHEGICLHSNNTDVVVEGRIPQENRITGNDSQVEEQIVSPEDPQSEKENNFLLDDREVSMEIPPPVIVSSSREPVPCEQTSTVTSETLHGMGNMNETNMDEPEQNLIVLKAPEKADKNESMSHSVMLPRKGDNIFEILQDQVSPKKIGRFPAGETSGESGHSSLKTIAISDCFAELCLFARENSAVHFDGVIFDDNDYVVETCLDKPKELDGPPAKCELSVEFIKPKRPVGRPRKYPKSVKSVMDVEDSRIEKEPGLFHEMQAAVEEKETVQEPNGAEIERESFPQDTVAEILSGLISAVTDDVIPNTNTEFMEHEGPAQTSDEQEVDNNIQNAARFTSGEQLDGLEAHHDSIDFDQVHNVSLHSPSSSTSGRELVNDDQSSQFLSDKSETPIGQPPRKQMKPLKQKRPVGRPRKLKKNGNEPRQEDVLETGDIIERVERDENENQDLFTADNSRSKNDRDPRQEEIPTEKEKEPRQEFSTTEEESNIHVSDTQTTVDMTITQEAQQENNDSNVMQGTDSDSENEVNFLNIGELEPCYLRLVFRRMRYSRQRGNADDSQIESQDDSPATGETDDVCMGNSSEKDSEKEAEADSPASVPPTHYAPNKEKPALTPVEGRQPIVILTDIKKCDNVKENDADKKMDKEEKEEEEEVEEEEEEEDSSDDEDHQDKDLEEASDFTLLHVVKTEQYIDESGEHFIDVHCKEIEPSQLWERSTSMLKKHDISDEQKVRFCHFFAQHEDLKEENPDIEIKDLTSEQKWQICRFGLRYGNNMASKYFSTLLGFTVTPRVVYYYIDKWNVLEDMHGRDPVPEDFDKSQRIFTEEEKNEMAKYSLAQGPCKAAREFSLKFMTYLSESNLRAYERWYISHTSKDVRGKVQDRAHKRIVWEDENEITLINSQDPGVVPIDGAVPELTLVDIGDLCQDLVQNQ